jgi:hypothetical protein
VCSSDLGEFWTAAAHESHESTQRSIAATKEDLPTNRTNEHE